MISVTNLKYHLTNIYEDLCKQYHITNCEFIMGNFKEILTSDYYFDQQYLLTHKQMLETIQYNHTNYYHSFMHSTFVWKNNKLKFRIIFPVENYLNLVYALAQSNRLDNTDDFVDFCIVVLKHEFGHVLEITQSYNDLIKNKKVTIDLVGRWSSKREKQKLKDMKQFYKYSDELWQKLENEEISDDEYNDLRSRAYFDMKAEADANNAIGLDIDEFNKLNIKYQAELEDWLYFFN